MSSSDGLQQVSKIVNSFFNKPETLAFREPVNPKAMGIPDYPQIVKNPMDLGTVSLDKTFWLFRRRRYAVFLRRQHYFTLIHENISNTLIEPHPRGALKSTSLVT